jgi:hypothetical protein
LTAESTLGIGFAANRTKEAPVAESATQGGSSGSDAFAKLGNLLRDPKGRKEFWLDPQKALRRVGVHHGEIPEPVQKVLQDLSYEELRVLGRVNDSLDEAGVPRELKGDMV